MLVKGKKEHHTTGQGASSPSRPGKPGSPFSPLMPRKPCLWNQPFNFSLVLQLVQQKSVFPPLLNGREISMSLHEVTDFSFLNMQETWDWQEPGSLIWTCKEMVSLILMQRLIFSNISLTVSDWYNQSRPSTSSPVFDCFACSKQPVHCGWKNRANSAEGQ